VPKKIYTTGEVAKLLGININTVIKWFDDGRIQGFRLPTSNDRRIPVSNLISFMRQHSIPMDLLESDTPMRRSHVRVPCDSAASFSVTNGKDLGSGDARILDLSQGGAKVFLTGEEGFTIPPRDFDVHLKVKEGPLKGVKLSGKMVHVLPFDDKLSIGMKFQDNEAAVMDRLQEFVEGELRT